ncbi:hypothetical protein BDV12DRAFT_176514 [Aspergillus spectabilis]
MRLRGPARSHQEWLTKPNRSQTVHFQISEKHIKFAAQVFNRLLIPKKLSNMVMRGFDSEALLIVLNVIHAKFETVPRQVSLEQLARICAVAEYFECWSALRFCIDMWLPHVRKSMSHVRFLRDLVLWLWLACELRFDEDWRDAAMKVIYQSPGPVPSLRLPFPNNITFTKTVTRRVSFVFS